MIDEQPIGAALSRDTRRGETVESDLNNLIAKRHNQRVASEGERRELEVWQETERHHLEQRRQVARIEWHLHHTAQAERLRRTLEELIEHHEGQAARLVLGDEDPRDRDGRKVEQSFRATRKESA